MIPCPRKDGNRYLMAGNRLVGINFTTNDDIYPYPALKYDLTPARPQNNICPEENLFLKAGNRFLKAGNRLVGHNFVTYDDMSILKEK
jgi:hypothetical protein